MPLVLGPGHPFDVLGHDVESRRGRLCLVVGLLRLLSAFAPAHAAILAFHVRSPPNT